jgi:hypothetical protein
MLEHFDIYSIRNCPECNSERVYKGAHHKKISREAERKNRLCNSCSSTGSRNGCFGRTKEKHPFYGKSRPVHSQFLKENNVMFKKEYLDRYFLTLYGVDAEAWAESKQERYLYFLEVIRETKKQDISKLENFEKLGLKNEGYQLDHIYPKSQGYHNNIPANLIGDIRNLQIIPGLENNKKNARIIYVPAHIEEYLKTQKKYEKDFCSNR